MGIIYSFDVFDTLLCRPYVLPVDVFCAIEKSLQLVNPALDKRVKKLYCRARIFSEIVARKKSTFEDISIEDIYINFGKLFNLESGVLQQLMLFEMQFEMEILRPIHGSAQYVEKCRNQGEIVFISDMYLPSDFIMKILVENGIARSGDKIYVSGDYGLTKGSGKLFEKVLDDYSISAQQLVHFGDNIISYYLVPVGMGITFNDFMGLPQNFDSRIKVEMIKIKKKVLNVVNVMKLFLGLYV